MRIASVPGTPAIWDDALRASFLSVAEQLGRVGLEFGDFGLDRETLRIDGREIFVGEVLHSAANPAGELHVRLQPGEAYLQLVAAVQRRCEAVVVVSHGWPILSVGPHSPTVTEAAGGSNAPAVEAA